MKQKCSLSDFFPLMFREIVCDERVKVSTNLYIASFDNKTFADFSCLFVSIFFVFAVVVIAVVSFEPFWLNSFMA